MPALNLRNALAAVAVCTSASLVYSHGQTNTEPARDTTSNLALAALSPPQQPAPKTSCAMRIVSYFDDRSISLVNAELGRIKDWLTGHKLYDPTLIEQYLGEGAEPDPDETHLQELFQEIFKLDGVYEAGSESGLAYLRQDPVNVMNAVYAYTAHVAALRMMLAEDLAASLEDKFGRSVESLRRTADETDMLMRRQLEDGCGRPRPAPQLTR